MSEVLAISVLIIVLLVYELAAHIKEHRQLSPFHELNRRAAAVEQIVKRDGNPKLRKHHGPKH